MRICCVDRGTISFVATEPLSRIDAQVDLISQGLAEQGHTVTLVCFSAKGPLARHYTIHQIQYFTWLERHQELAVIYFALRASVWLFRNKAKFDVIHFQGAYVTAFFFSFLCVFEHGPPRTIAHAPPSSDTPRTSTILPREWYTPIIGRMAIRLMLKRAFDSCSRVIVINTKSMMQLSHYFGNQRKMRIIQFTLVDTHLFAPNNTFPPESDTFEVLCVARVQPRKNQLAILKAAALTVGDSVRFTFVGPDSPTYRKELELFSKQTNIQDRVRFVGYVPSYHALSRYFSHAALYVLLSESESGIPTTIAQALSSGLPIILSNIFSKEVILREAGAEFVNPEVSKDIADLIIRYQKSAVLLESKRSLARKVAVKYFDYWRVASSIYVILEDAMKDNSQHVSRHIP